MRKTLLVLILLISAKLSVVAHTIGVGYALYQPGTASGLMGQGKAECSAAVLLGSEKLGKYQGNEIRTVRVSLEKTRLFVDSVVVWVRHELDGENLAVGKVTRFKDDGYANMDEGWNEVALDRGVAIGADSRLYVGYTYYQRKTLCDTRLVGTATSACSFVKLGASEPWSETQGGTLAIEAGVDGDNMPALDVSLIATKGIIMGDGTRMIEARVCNRGQNTVTALGLHCVGQQYLADLDVAADVLPDRLDTLTVSVDDITGIAPGTVLDVNISTVNGNDNADAAPLPCLFNYQRIVLVEEFTTEDCPNCPAAAAYLHDILAEDKSLARQMAVVCHHSGFHTDGFTTSADLAYEWFYNNDGATSAPSMMYNRKPMHKSDGGMTPCSFPDSRKTVEDNVKAIADAEASLVITATARLTDDGKQIVAQVSGNRLKPFGNTDQRITVFLTEDNVLAEAQAGSGTDTYYHQHVMRALNATWGEPIEWNGDDFSYTCCFDVDAAWKLADLKIVASVGDYDSADPANCQIENTAVAVPSVPADIRSVNAADNGGTPTYYYNMGGQRIQAPSHGLCIVKLTDGKVKKIANR